MASLDSTINSTAARAGFSLASATRGNFNMRDCNPWSVLIGAFRLGFFCASALGLMTAMAISQQATHLVNSPLYFEADGPQTNERAQFVARNGAGAFLL